MLFLLKWLPRNFLSYWFGKLMHLQFPKPFSTLAIWVFAKIYSIDTAAAEKNLNEYKSIGDFFTRKLKKGIRPLAESPLLHPADSVIAQIGVIHNGQLIQAKGRAYRVSELLKDFKAEVHYNEGLFVTYYLCPTDYHRVHSPVDGVIKRFRYVPGDLWPVNQISVDAIENLFPKNERVILDIHSRLGDLSLVFVGATNVGKISLRFEPDFYSNQCKNVKFLEKEYPSPIEIKKGEELGTFHMGSTVVMVYPKVIADQYPTWEDFKGKKVCFGEALI